MRSIKFLSQRVTQVASLLSIGAFIGIIAPAHASPVFDITDLATDNNANLTSLGYPGAANVDPHLVNPWGVSFAGASPFWVSDNATGVSTLYNAAGVPAGGPLVVTIAPPAVPPPGFTTSAPTGQVFNNNPSDFIVSNGTTSGSANFIFATEDGTISGRSGAVSGGTQSIRVVDNSSSGAVYKGLAIASIVNPITHTSDNFLFAANFNSGKIEEYNSSFGLVRTFTDSSLPPVPAGTPAGQNWAPFNVQFLNGQLYVTFALQNAAKHDDVAGAGNGFVDVFNTDGTFVTRLVNTGAGDPLDSPWGLAIAPAAFGGFGGDLLVGNFGNGEINVFNPTGGGFLGTLDASNGNPLQILGLWALTVGNGGAGVIPDGIYFTAGLPAATDPSLLEQDGVFGVLTPRIPEPSSLAFLAPGLAGLMWFRGRRRAATSIPARRTVS